MAWRLHFDCLDALPNRPLKPHRSAEATLNARRNITPSAFPLDAI
jgi:hypothetical protein